VYLLIFININEVHQYATIFIFSSYTTCFGFMQPSSGGFPRLYGSCCFCNANFSFLIRVNTCAFVVFLISVII
jgi:hypothetical protein